MYYPVLNKDSILENSEYILLLFIWFIKIMNVVYYTYVESNKYFAEKRGKRRSVENNEH